MELTRAGNIAAALVVGILAVGALPVTVLAQEPPPHFSPPDLYRMAGRIALYPDPLLAQVLAAATYPDQIPDAASWADRHHYLTGDDLARAIEADQLPWDPSVQALLPFPSVLDMMASDMGWTTDLGNAFLAQQPELMDAVQRMRHQAWDFGYLRSGGQVIVRQGPYIEIVPANPAFIVVPYYDPMVVYMPPRRGIVVGGVIRFGYGVTIGMGFRPWGWYGGGGNRFVWNTHTVIVNQHPWHRDWDNRPTYVHPYEGVHRYDPPVRHDEGMHRGEEMRRVPEIRRTGPPPQVMGRAEEHRLQERTPREREAARSGQPRVEEHRDNGGRDHDRGRGHDRER